MKEPRRLWQAIAKWDPYKRIIEFGSMTGNENCHHCTCFHRMRPRLNTPPALSRMRSKPMSMMRSNRMSVMSAVTTVNLVLSKSITAQVVCSGNHSEWTYGCSVSKSSRSKTVVVEIHLYDTCDMTRLQDNLPWSEEYLPLMRNATSVVHMAIVIPKIIFCLFQIATLSSIPKHPASGEWS